MELRMETTMHGISVWNRCVCVCLMLSNDLLLYVNASELNSDVITTRTLIRDHDGMSRLEIDSLWPLRPHTTAVSARRDKPPHRPPISPPPPCPQSRNGKYKMCPYSHVAELTKLEYFPSASGPPSSQDRHRGMRQRGLVDISYFVTMLGLPGVHQKVTTCDFCWYVSNACSFSHEILYNC